jgi:uncharacterized protein
MPHKRILDIKSFSQRKSLFLFGPRSTGKTTLLREVFDQGAIINLLKSSVYLSLSGNPALLVSMVREIRKRHPVIVIDEIQKLPVLLDEVHNLIEAEGIRFILTGSSARKLRKGGVNLLAGRAWECRLFPLVSREIETFDIHRYLLYGGMPQVYDSQWPEEELDAYINTYLKEEIKEEAVVRDLVHFSRFLKTVGMANGGQINYANIASDTGIPASTVRSWFEILEDTFLAFLLEPWRGSKKRKAVATVKFYLFDVGVANFLKGVGSIERNSDSFGISFEHFIAMELRSYLSYKRIKKELCYWRTGAGQEVDFVIGDDVAIEVKSASRIGEKQLKGLRYLMEEGVIGRFFLVSFDEIDRESEDGIRILHWRSFLAALWDGEITIG